MCTLKEKLGYSWKQSELGQEFMFFLAGEDVLGFARNCFEKFRTPSSEMCTQDLFYKNVYKTLQLM